MQTPNAREPRAKREGSDSRNDTCLTRRTLMSYKLVRVSDGHEDVKPHVQDCSAAGKPGLGSVTIWRCSYSSDRVFNAVVRTYAVGTQPWQKLSVIGRPRLCGNPDLLTDLIRLNDRLLSCIRCTSSHVRTSGSLYHLTKSRFLVFLCAPCTYTCTHKKYNTYLSAYVQRLLRDFPQISCDRLSLGAHAHLDGHLVGRLQLLKDGGAGHAVAHDQRQEADVREEKPEQLAQEQAAGCAARRRWWRQRRRPPEVVPQVSDNRMRRRGRRRRSRRWRWRSEKRRSFRGRHPVFLLLVDLVHSPAVVFAYGHRAGESHHEDEQHAHEGQAQSEDEQVSSTAAAHCDVCNRWNLVYRMKGFFPSRPRPTLVNAFVRCQGEEWAAAGPSSWLSWPLARRRPDLFRQQQLQEHPQISLPALQTRTQ